MPWKSQKQRALMEGVEHNPNFAQKVGIPQKVGKEFNSASQGMKISSLPPTMAQPKMPHIQTDIRPLPHETAPNPQMMRYPKLRKRMGF